MTMAKGTGVTKDKDMDKGTGKCKDTAEMFGIEIIIIRPCFLVVMDPLPTEQEIISDTSPFIPNMNIQFIMWIIATISYPTSVAYYTIYFTPLHYSRASFHKNLQLSGKTTFPDASIEFVIKFCKISDNEACNAASRGASSTMGEFSLDSLF
jgi:hypothetical protein